MNDFANHTKLAKAMDDLAHHTGPAKRPVWVRLLALLVLAFILLFVLIMSNLVTNKFMVEMQPVIVAAEGSTLVQPVIGFVIFVVYLVSYIVVPYLTYIELRRLYYWKLKYEKYSQ